MALLSCGNCWKVGRAKSGGSGAPPAQPTRSGSLGGKLLLLLSTFIWGGMTTWGGITQLAPGKLLPGAGDVNGGAKMPAATEGSLEPCGAAPQGTCPVISALPAAQKAGGRTTFPFPKQLVVPKLSMFAEGLPQFQLLPGAVPPPLPSALQQPLQPPFGGPSPCVPHPNADPPFGGPSFCCLLCEPFQPPNARSSGRAHPPKGRSSCASALPAPLPAPFQPPS